MLNRQLVAPLLSLLLLTTLANAEPPESGGEPKKPLVLPPFPDEDPDLPLLPPPVKLVPAAETAPPPRVNDTNKPFDVIVVAASENALPAGDRVAVGFFNHGDRDLMLEIDKRPVRLPSRHYLQVKVPREFSWREKEGALQTTKVPADADGVEIVFRR